MAKVRWSQKCAGGCGTFFTIGQSATHLHGGFWCHSCLVKHQPPGYVALVASSRRR